MNGKRVHHLRPLRGVEGEPATASLDFALMAAVKHSERGDGAAMLTALADAIWLMHAGPHERVSDNRMVTLLRSFAGMEWVPTSDPDGAA